MNVVENVNKAGRKKWITASGRISIGRIHTEPNSIHDYLYSIPAPRNYKWRLHGTKGDGVVK